MTYPKPAHDQVIEGRSTQVGEPTLRRLVGPSAELAPDPYSQVGLQQSNAGRAVEDHKSTKARDSGAKTDSLVVGCTVSTAPAGQRLPLGSIALHPGW